MSPIGMPANRLTATCIWNSFRSSGKRHLILTGTRGSGKTSLLARLFPDQLPGLTTRVKPHDGVYLRENISGKTVQVGIFDPTLPGPGNQMVPLEEGFASLGAAALARCAACGSDWITVDEIGYLEARCYPYCEALSALLEQKHVAAVVRKQELPFLQALCRWEDAFVVDLDDPFGRSGCVIMASGLGTRFGGNKLMADFRGEPMLCAVLKATDGLFAQRVVITRHEDVAALCRELGIDVVLHRLPHRSDTVRLGLEALGGVENCMFCPGDQPLLQADTAAALLLAARNDPAGIWRTAFGETQGMPILFPAWTFPELLRLPQGKGGRILLKKYPERLHTVSVRDLYELKDVDRPEDLRELAER